jgi:hypothetical protein
MTYKDAVAALAALLWAGDDAAAAGRSAAELYGFEGVTASRPEIVVPPERRARSATVVVHHAHHRGALMTRTVRGVRVTGVEPTLVALAHSLEPEAFEIACEDARRRGLTSVAAIGSYLERWGRRGRPGVAATRALMAELDPVNASRSALEVKTRRLLVANDLGDFTREFPLGWNGRTYRYDFAFERSRVILEVNGRRWRRSVHRTRREAARRASGEFARQRAPRPATSMSSRNRPVAARSVVSTAPPGTVTSDRTMRITHSAARAMSRSGRSSPAACAASR